MIGRIMKQHGKEEPEGRLPFWLPWKIKGRDDFAKVAEFDKQVRERRRSEPLIM